MARKARLEQLDRREIPVLWGSPEWLANQEKMACKASVDKMQVSAL